MMWLPAAIAGVASLASGGISAAAAKRANDRSFNQTKQLYGMQVQDRDAQNRWNSPANQVALLKSAGLSPASFYGGTSQTAVSAGVPSAGSAEVAVPDISGAVSSGASAAINSLLAASQKRSLDTQSDLNAAKAVESLTSSARSKFDLDLAKDLRENTLAQSQANLDKTIQETALAKANEVLSGVDAEYRRVGILLTQNQIQLNDKQKELFDAQINRLGYQNWESLSQIEKNKADANLANETARQVCYSIEHVLPAMVADYCASADLKSMQAWNEDETRRFQEFYNDNVMQYLPAELEAKVKQMNRETKIMAQQNVRDWIKLPAEFVRDAGIGVGACAKLFGPAPAAMAKIGF